MTTFELWSGQFGFILGILSTCVDSISSVIFKLRKNVEGGDKIETLKWNKISKQSLCVSWGRGYKYM